MTPNTKIQTDKLKEDAKNFLGVLLTITKFMDSNPEDKILKAQTIYCLKLLMDTYHKCQLTRFQRIKGKSKNFFF